MLLSKVIFVVVLVA